MNKNLFAVIMAGGGGTRLWPLSRRNRPKQMLSLTGDDTLFQVAVDRMTGLLPPEQIIVVTVEEQARELSRQKPEIPWENFLLEPKPRGTASVVALAAQAIQLKDPNAVMIILTADHFIKDVEKFHHLITCGKKVAEEGFLVTLGIEPLYPASGYGYIQRGKQLGVFDGIPYYQVVKFKEKPNQELAMEFIRNKDHDWNSGMFFWKAARILEEMEIHMPDLFNEIITIQKAWNTPDRDKVLSETWEMIKPETIDYGIMEKASQVACIPASDLGWNDVGSWESIFDVLPADEKGNIILADNVALEDTTGTLIVNEDTNTKLIAVIGLDGIVVVDTPDAILICKKSETQKVKKIVDFLKKDGNQQLL
ncbi:MAG: NTP transferase domain-containing protein [Leptolinea sp.]|nr:NTP transferase domain-containing protein [Leptolinea sp.]